MFRIYIFDDRFKNKLNQIERNEKRQNIKAFKNEIID